MTIAACYVCSEGIVLGADSTWTVPVSSLDGKTVENRLFEHGQKLFHIGKEDSPFGVVMWGLVTLPGVSNRLLIAKLNDRIDREVPKSVKDVAESLGDLFWEAYKSEYADRRKELSELKKKGDALSEPEKVVLEDLTEDYRGGFCVAGYCLPDREPKAFEVLYSLEDEKAREPKKLKRRPYFWGWGNLVDRLTVGMDRGLLDIIVDSGKWQGTRDELRDLVRKHSSFGRPMDLPIREALDLVDASLYATVKALKFSYLPPVCGGPIDLAVITVDRPFRWVRRKPFHAAIDQGLGYIQ
jgi:hypothetical protein